MTRILPEGTILRIEMELRLPVAATVNEVEEWLRYEMAKSGGCSHANPLLDKEPEEWAHSFEVHETGLVGRVEEFDNAPIEGGGRTYHVRYITEKAPS